MKRFQPLTIFLLVLSSFFFFLSRPYADEVTMPLNSYYTDLSPFDYFTLNGYDIRECVSTWMSSSENQGKGYLITAIPTSSTFATYDVFLFPDSFTEISSLSFGSYDSDRWFTFNSFGQLNTSVVVYRSYGCDSFQNANWAYWNNIRFYETERDSSRSRMLIYSTVPVLCGDWSCDGNIFTITYDGKTYTLPKNSNDKSFVPTLSQLYDYWYGEPPDSYPLLTDFFTLVIDRITYLSGYFVENYVYLSLFAIFIIITFIYLLKRRLF